jgi:hypothetical protein
MIHRRKWHRCVFLAAGLYHLGWGIWSLGDPQWFFRLTGMEPANHPQVFGYLGILAGLFGVLYLTVSWSPERGWLIVVVGSAGKFLGGIGATGQFNRGLLPSNALALFLTSDMIWAPLFILYLYDAWPPKFWGSFVDWLEAELEDKPERRRTIAYEFDCDLSLGELRALFNRTGPSTWMERDSEWYGDYMSSAIKDGCMAKLYERTDEPGSRYVIQFKIEPLAEVRDSDLPPVLVNLLLPAGARNLRSAEPYD